MKKFIIPILSAAFIGGGFTTAIAADDHKDHASQATLPKDYPLKTCPVSGDNLGEHGKPVKATTPDGIDVYLCCKDCLKDFKKDPAKFAKMVKDAEAQAKK